VRPATITVGAVAGVLLLAGCTSSDGAADADLDQALALPSPSESAAALDDRPLDEQLGAAIQSGDAATVSLALDAGADPNADIGGGASALSAAVVRDDSAMVAALIAAGADVTATSSTGETPLHLAADHAGADVTRALLQAGAPVEVFDSSPFKASPLHAAAYSGNLEALQTMLEEGAPVDLANPEFGATALFFAAYWDRPEVVELLVIGGASVNYTELDGDTALDVAVAQGSADAAAALETHGGVTSADL